MYFNLRYLAVPPIKIVDIVTYSFNICSKYLTNNYELGSGERGVGWGGGGEIYLVFGLPINKTEVVINCDLWRRKGRKKKQPHCSFFLLKDLLVGRGRP